MSIQAVRTVLNNRGDLTDAEFIVLIAIAEHADDEGECFPSVTRLAGYLARSNRQTQRVIAGLVDGGVLQRVSRWRAGRQTTNQYRVDLLELQRRRGDIQTSPPHDIQTSPPHDIQVTPPPRHPDDTPINRQGNHHGNRQRTTPPPPKGGGASKGKAKKDPSTGDKQRPAESLEGFPEAWRQDKPFTEAMADYLRVRREKRNAITEHGMRLMTKKLLEHTVERATLALSQSAANGWTGVFPDRQPAPAAAGKDEKQQRLF